MTKSSASLQAGAFLFYLPALIFNTKSQHLSRGLAKTGSFLYYGEHRIILLCVIEGFSALFDMQFVWHLEVRQRSRALSFEY